ncbi:restriction endonuclease [Sporosarcina sp. Marseille-Q4063]|nr:restriction endonuclease [Sporosarcina sp. Marseille-Q4063]
MQDVLSGRAKVTQASGDYGVDILHTLPNRDVYLVQVKCYKPENQISFDPPAVLHSNIVTRNAQGAYLITTSDYSPQAKQFGDVHGIKLINGYNLALHLCTFQINKPLIRCCTKSLPKPNFEDELILTLKKLIIYIFT